MQNYLELLSRTITDKGQYYTVKHRDKVYQLTYAQTVRLINQYPSQHRNCRINSGAIQLKQGMLSVTDYTTGKTTASAAEQGEKVLHIYTEKKFIKTFGRDYYIESNDIVFPRWSADTELIKSCEKYIRTVDNITEFDYNNYKALSPFGWLEFTQFSTGLKAVINAAHFVKLNSDTPYLINISECGANALDCIYEVVSNTNISLYTESYPMSLPDEYTYIVNEKRLAEADDFPDMI